MTDDELATYLGIAKSKNRDAIMAAITPERRAVYEEMALKELAIRLYLDGKGPRPAGVIVCRQRPRRRH